MFFPNLSIVTRIYEAKSKALDPKAIENQKVAANLAEVAVQREVDKGGELLAGADAQVVAVAAELKAAEAASEALVVDAVVSDKEG